MNKLWILIGCIIAVLLVTGCVGQYSPNPKDNRVDITAYQVKERSLLQWDSLVFTCYLIDINDVVYRVRYEDDCIRFKSGVNYTIVLDSEQYLVFAERRI